MRLEASVRMPSDCEDRLIHAKRPIEESGSQSKGVSHPRGPSNRDVLIGRRTGRDTERSNKLPLVYQALRWSQMCD